MFGKTLAKRLNRIGFTRKNGIVCKQLSTFTCVICLLSLNKKMFHNGMKFIYSFKNFKLHRFLTKLLMRKFKEKDKRLSSVTQISNLILKVKRKIHNI